MESFPSIITTTSTPGASAPLVFYVPTATTYGQWATIEVVDDGDQRDADNLMTPAEGTKINLDFVAARTLDLIYGGAYDTVFRAAVTIANSLTIDRSYSNGSTSCLILHGSTGANAIAADFYGSDPSGTALRATAGAAGTGIFAYGGASSGSAINATAQGGNAIAIQCAGHGSGAGLKATAGGTSGTAAAELYAGPLYVDANLGSGSDPGVNHLWGTSIPKAWAAISTSGGTVTIADDLNIDTVAVDGVDTKKLNVTFKRAMQTADYAVTYGAPGSTSGPTFFLCGTVSASKTTTGFSFVVWSVVGAVQVDFAGASLHLDFHVDGRM